MKRTLAILITAAFLAGPLHAQARVGVLGGFVSSNVSFSGGDFTYAPSSRSGFAAGLSVAGNVAPDVAVGANVLYVQKGYNITEGNVTYSVHGAYIEVPVLAHLYVGPQSTRGFILAGPAVGFKASCTESESESGEGSISASCDSQGAQIKSTDFSLVGGVGIAIRQLSVEVRYDLGLTNVDNNADDNAAGISAKNHALLILAGLSFGK